MINLRIGIAKQNGRMSGDNELRIFLQLVDDAQKSKLPCRGKGGFRLIQQIDSFPPEPVLEQRQEGLSMRMLMQRFPPVRPVDSRVFLGYLVYVVGEGVEGFRPQEEALVDLGQPRKPYIVPEPRLGGCKLKQIVPAPSRGIKTALVGDCLQQGRFPRAILSDEEGYIFP